MIKQAFATIIPRDDATSIVDDANTYRYKADPHEKPDGILIPLHEAVTPRDGPGLFWTQIFALACVKGPRTLAALLETVPDTQFPDEAKRDRAELLAYLRNLSNSQPPTAQE